MFMSVSNTKSVITELATEKQNEDKRAFQNQLPIGWLRKYKIENKLLFYGAVTYITALPLHIVAIHV